MKNSSVILVFSLFSLVACSKKPCEDAESAKFKDLTGLDGCGIIIELNDGTRLEPINLSDFDVTPEDGKSIWVKYHNVSGGSICMVGQMVEIDCLEEK